MTAETSGRGGIDEAGGHSVPSSQWSATDAMWVLQSTVKVPFMPSMEWVLPLVVSLRMHWNP